MHRHFLGIEVALVNANLIFKLGNIRHVNPHRAVFKRLHKLVVLQAAVLWLVGVTDDNFINIGLGKLLGFDFVFLAGAQQIVEESDVKFEHLDKLDNTPVGDVELAIKIKGARIAIAAVDGDFTIVDVAGEFGRVLIFLILGLESTNANPILLTKDKAVYPDMSNHLGPVAIIPAHQLAMMVAAGGTQVAGEADLFISRPVFIEAGYKTFAHINRNEMQGVFVHRARLPFKFWPFAVDFNFCGSAGSPIWTAWPVESV